MDVSFERSMNHNYMILSSCDFFGSDIGTTGDFRTKMLLENQIQGLLPVTHRLVNGESRYYYEINSLQSLERVHHKNEIKDEELRKILKGFVNLFERLDEYLLDGSQIIIKPEFIYINVETLEPYFVCYPDYEEDARSSFMEFVDLLLTKIDHNDEKAVMLGYQIYKYTRNPNYVMGEILNIMGREEVKLRKAQELANEPVSTAFNITSNATPINANVSENQISKPLYDMSNVSSEELYKKTKKKLFGNKKSSEDLPEKNKKAKSNKKDGVKPESIKDTKSKITIAGIGNIIGIIICAIIAFCSGALIIGAKAMNIKINANAELYIYGAFAVSVAAAVLFVICIMKNKKRKKEIEALQSEPQDPISQNQVMPDVVVQPPIVQTTTYQEYVPQTSQPLQLSYSQPSSVVICESSETEFLELEPAESRVLIGFVNGNEMRIQLDRLPLTIGKKSGVSDIILDDHTVSRMHARFEEHNGRVCICDLNSTNGTLRNGEMIDMNRLVALEVGDKLRIGKSCFTYC